MISLPEFGYLEAESRLEIPTINKQGMYLEYIRSRNLVSKNPGRRFGAIFSRYPFRTIVVSSFSRIIEIINDFRSRSESKVSDHLQWISVTLAPPSNFSPPPCFRQSEICSTIFLHKWTLAPPLFSTVLETRGGAKVTDIHWWFTTRLRKATLTKAWSQIRNPGDRRRNEDKGSN